MPSPINRALLVLRSMIFYLTFVLVTIFYSSLCLLIGPFLPFEKKHAMIAFWGQMFLWLIEFICGVKYRIRGREFIGNAPTVVMSKHQSDWETYAFLTLFNPQSTVVKKELFAVPFFGWALKLKDAIGIDRSQKTSALKQLIEQGVTNIQKGCWIMVFPEGTRTAPGQPSTYSSGGALLAQKAGVAITPIAHNAGELCPPRGYIKYPGIIDVVIGPQISTEGKKAKVIMDEVETWIRSTMAEISAKESFDPVTCQVKERAAD